MTRLRVVLGALFVIAAMAATSALAAGQGGAVEPAWHLARFPASLVPAARALLRPSVGAGRTSSDTRNNPLTRHIVGGSSATQGEFGYMAFVVFFQHGRPLFSCSGTIVSANVILTAGHCAVKEGTRRVLPARNYRVVTGAVNWTDTAHRRVHKVKRVILDPRFDPKGPVHDASLLVLASPTHERPIPLWRTGHLRPGTEAAIAGWGKTFAAQTSITEVLQYAPTVIQSSRYCSHAHLANYTFHPSSELCVINAPSYNTGTCNGDSGGPLLVLDRADHPLEVGLTSVGPANCTTLGPDYFTKIRPIDSWVRSRIRRARR
jgi:secreted trypsin-like serine protease